MNYLRLLLLPLLMLGSAMGQSSYLFYNNQESAASGTQITTNILNSDTTTNGFTGYWTINPATHTKFAVTNDNDSPLRAPFLIGSTLFSGTSDTKTYLVEASGTSERACQYNFGLTNCGQYAIGYKFRFGPAVGIAGNFNFVDTAHINLTSGDFAVAALRNENDTLWALRIHTGTGTSGGVGPDVLVGPNTNWWVSILVDTNNGAQGTAKLAVYNMANWRCVGISSLVIGTRGMAQYLKFGHLNDHTIAGVTPMWYDDFMLATGATAVSSWPLRPVGGTVDAASVSRTDFDTAYTNAQSSVGTNHDIVAIPTGSATWTSGYTIAKNGVVIKGNGTNNTTITGDNGTTQFDLFTVTGNFNTISNFTITGDGSNDELTGIRNSASYNRYSRLQIKECSVGVFAENPGLIDNSLILNCEHSSRNIFGSSFYDTWNPLPLDSTNAFYYEDCRIQWTSAKNTTGPSPFMTSQEGQAWVVRHCYFEITQAGTGAEPAFDHHGDWDPGSQAFYRPGTMLQIYSNVFNFTQDSPSAHGCKFVDVRGGPFTMIYSNNVLAGNYASSDGIVYREEHMFDDATPYTLTNAFNFRNTQPNGNIPVNNPLENGGQVFAGREYTNVAPAVLVQLVYPHPLRNEVLPPTIINSCCAASIGAGRVRGVIVSRP